MTRNDPPRLVVALLRRFLPHDEPLAGDLIERYGATGSRLWLWRQAIMAIVLRGFVARDREHPLGLADRSGPPEERYLPLEPFHIDRLAASPVPGVGGLGVIALAVLLVLFLSDVWLFLLLALAGGLALAVIITLLRRPPSTLHIRGD